MVSQKDQVVIYYRDPECAYCGDMLWLPKKHINIFAVRAKASMYCGGNDYIEAFWETERHLIVPRTLSIPNASFPIINYGPKDFPVVPWECTAESRDIKDVRSWAALQDAKEGIMHLRCGAGKTVLALRKIAKEQGPACIVVHTSQLLEQWVERIQEFMLLEGKQITKQEIGVVSGSKEEWDRPIVLAMIQTLSKRLVPAHIRRRFKVVVYDEAHHLAAPKWMRTGAFGYGMRFGLTATPENSRGTHLLYYLHLGQILHTDLEQPLTPDCYFVKVPGNLLPTDDVLDRTRQFSFPKLNTVLGKKVHRNQIIATEIQRALDSGRKILVLSHSKDHCYTLHSMFPDSGICVEEVPPTQRLHYLKTKKVIFGIMQLAKEGLDQKDLDTVMITTPFRDKNMLQQIVGRIQREGGEHPVAVIFEDYQINACYALCTWLKRHLLAWGYPIKEVK